MNKKTDKPPPPPQDTGSTALEGAVKKDAGIVRQEGVEGAEQISIDAGPPEPGQLVRRDRR